MIGYGHRNARLLLNGGHYVVKMSIWSLRRSNCSSKILLQMGKPKSISNIRHPNIKTRIFTGCVVGTTEFSIRIRTPILAFWPYVVEVKIPMMKIWIQSSWEDLIQILETLLIQYRLV